MKYENNMICIFVRIYLSVNRFNLFELIQVVFGSYHIVLLYINTNPPSTVHTEKLHNCSRKKYDL